MKKKNKLKKNGRKEEKKKERKEKNEGRKWKRKKTLKEKRFFFKAERTYDLILRFVTVSWQ